jgi:8-hydroxy-5-deazaflavin:NADPH oxidoreductase
MSWCTDFNATSYPAALSYLQYSTRMKTWSSKLNVAIIGNGSVGAALGQALGRCAHQVMFGLRNPARGARHECTIPEAIRQAQVTVLAVPFAAVADVIQSAGDLSGKIVIDATNPLGLTADGLGLTRGFSTSGAEQIAALAPGALLFKAFNQTGFENLADASSYALPPVMFVAGDDANGKRTVMSLVADAGFDAVDLGGLRQARLLEPLAMLWIELARKRGRGPNFTFSLQPRGSAP